MNANSNFGLSESVNNSSGPDKRAWCRFHTLNLQVNADLGYS